MNKIIYVALPVAAFVLILSNAFFGHLIFGSPYDQDINKYSIYVHLQEGWNSSSSNILFEITNVWSNPDPSSDAKSFSINPSDISMLTDYNSNHLQSQHSKNYVELKHEFSNCETNWKPILYRYGIDTLRAKIEMMQGNELNEDPYISIFPKIPNLTYDDKHQQQLIRQGYAQFIPICTASETTSYEYSISINDKSVGFDTYFVPSKNEIGNFLAGDFFNYYNQEGCFAQNVVSFSGTCKNVDKDSGLLIIIPDDLHLSLTKIRISTHELV